MVAQKAESAGDNSSIIRFQISAATGSRKCKPLFTVGPASGHLRMGSFGSSSCNSGYADSYFMRAIYVTSMRAAIIKTEASPARSLIQPSP